MWRHPGHFGRWFAVPLLLAAAWAAKPASAPHLIHIDGILIDKYCAGIAIASHDGYLPVVHQKACLILAKPCVQQGLGVIRGDQFYPFSPASNRQMVAAARRLKRADDLTISVVGTWNGKTLTVKSYHWR